LISATSTITSAANITGANILTGGLVSATGNVTGNYIIGNGSQLTSITGGNVTGNVNSAVTAGTVTTNAQPNITSVGTLTSVTSSGLISTTGNVQSANVFATANISATGNVTGNYHIGNGSQLSSITGGNVTGQVGNALIAGAVYTNAQPNITSVGTLTSVTSSGLISTTGNVQGANIFATANISATGNVTGNYIIGNGSTLSSITGGNVTGQVGNALISGTVYTNAQPNITSVGTLTSITSSGLISTTGNVQGANVFATANISATANVIGGNLLTAGQISSTGNITVSPTGFFVGNIIGNVTGNLAVPGANTQILYNNQGNVGASAGFTFNAATNAMVVTGNTTSGNILTAGLISATGNVTGNYIIGNGSQLSSITGGNVTGQVGNALIAGTVYTNAQPNITSVGTLTSVTSSGLISTTGNVQSANVFATANISATGNVTGNYIIGNGSTLSSITGGNVTGQVGNALISGTVYTNAQPNITSVGTLTSLTVTGNTTSGNLLTAGLISATSTITSAANITGGNVLTAGLISSTGNATAGNILTSGLISATSTITSAANIIAGNIITAGQVSATGNLNGGALSVSGNAVIVGNLNVQGNVTFIGSNVITTNDLYIQLANNQSTYANINNAGLAVGPAGTPLTYWQYQNASNAWTTNVSISATANVIGGNLLTAGQISSTGNVTVSPTGFFVGNVIGNITGNLAVPGANTQILYNNQGNVGASAGFTFNAATNAMVVTGNVTGANILTAGFVSASGNVTGNYIIGNGSTLSSITGGNVTGQVGNALISGTVYTNAQPNITSVGTLTSVTSSGLISTTGNVQGANIFATANISATANVIGGNLLTAGLISATGNVTGNYHIGNGSTLSSITGGNVTGQVGNALIAGTVYTNAQPNITSVGTLTSVTSSGLISTTGNVQGANVFATANISATSNIIGGNISTSGQISSTGNITVSPTGFFVGNIIGNVTGNLAVPGANTQILYNNQGNVGASAGFTFNAATNAMVVTGNTTSANILTGGLVSATGNVTGNYIIGNGSQLTSLTGGNVTGQVGNALISGTVYTNAQPNITSVGTLTSLSVTGNITSGNLLTSGLISAAGNTYANIFITAGSGGNISGTGNITGGNLLTGGQISSTGNITIGSSSFFVGNVIGNISGNLSTPGANTQVLYNNQGNAGASAGFTFNAATNAVVVTGNTTSGNILTAGLISATGNIQGANVFATANISAVGNVTGGNILTAGLVSATGNVTGNFILGNGAFLSGVITSVANINNGTSNVTVVSSGGNITVGVSGVGNVVIFAPTGEYVAGVVSASGNINGGNLLTAGLISATSNVLAGNLLTSGLVSATANISGGNILTGGQISSTGNITVSPTGFFVGNIIGNVTGNLAVPGANTQILYNNQGNVGASAGFTFNAATNAMVVTGNTTSANVLTGGLVSATGNVTGNYIIGNGSQLSSITGGNVTGQVGNALISGTVYTNAQPNITSVGTLTSVTSSGLISTTGNVQGANVFATANISAAGNVTGGNLFTSGGGGSISGAGSITAGGNITGGNILTGGQISTVGNITVGSSSFFVGNIIGNVTGNLAVPGANTQVLYNNQGNVGASAGFTFNAATNVMTVSGNTTSGNVLTGGLISATSTITSAANIIGGNIITAGLISATSTITSAANIIAGNIITAGQVSASGNLNGGALSVSGNAVIVGSLNVQGNVTFIGSNVITTNDLYIELANNQTTYANINNAGLAVGPAGTPLTYWQYQTASNAWTTNVSISATANVIGGNILTGGQISSTGNITTSPTGFFVGNIIGNVTGNLAVPGANTYVLYNNQGNVGASAGFTFNAATNALGVTGTISGSNFLTGGYVSASGNVTGSYFVGSGNGLSNIQGASVTGTVSSATTATTATTAGTVTTNAQPNITSVGTLSTLSVTGNTTTGNLLSNGQISTQGNITTASYFIGTFLGSISGNITAPGTNTQVIYNNSGNLAGSTGFTYNSATNAISGGGNIIANSNVIVGGNITSAATLTGYGLYAGNAGGTPLATFVYNNTTLGWTSNVPLAPAANTSLNLGQTSYWWNNLYVVNINTSTIGASGNITGGNLLYGSGLVSGTGNIYANNVLATTIVNAASHTGSVVSVTGNITGNNIIGANLITTVGSISATGNITTANYFIGTFQGNISGNLTVPGANTQIIYNNSGNAGASAGLTFNAGTNALVSTGTVSGSNFLTGGYVSATGNVTGNYIIGNGSTLSSITGGNVTGTVANATYAVSAGTAGTVTTNAQPNVTSLGTLTGLSSTGLVTTSNQISATGNIITNSYFIGTFLGSISGNVTAPGLNTQVIFNNSGNLAGSPGFTFNQIGNALTANGNITGANILTTGLISATSTITGSTFYGSGAGLSSLTGANVTGTVANATYAASAGTAGTVTTNAQPNITSVGNLVGLSAGGNIITTGQISAAGNITIGSSSFFVGNVIGNITGNLSTPGANTQVIYNNNGNAGASAGFTFNSATNAVAVTGNTTSGNFLTAGYVSATGNVTGSYIIGSGAFLTSLPGGNVTGTVANATYAASAGTAGTVTANAQPNITSVGTLTSIISSGNISATGSISSLGNITTGGYFIGNVVGNISGNFTVPGSNTQVIYNNNGNAGASAGLTFNAGTNALATSGNITVGGTATTAATLSGYGLLGGNAGGTPVATFVYNNSAQAWTSNVAVAPAANVSLNLGQTGYWWNNFYAVNVNTSAIAASGNITGGNILTGGVISSTGNITGANLSTGIVVASGNITGSNILTGGTVSSTGNAIHGNILTAGQISATANITTASYFVGTFAGSISGNVTAPGANTQVVYNNSGNLAGSSNFIFNQSTNLLSVNGNITTSGVTTTSGLIDISGTASALRIASPGGASYATTTASITGCIKITLPQGYTNTMMRMTVKVYTYDGQSFEINLGGYNYAPTTTWVNTFADMTTGARASLNVSFGYDGTNCCIYIGETSTVWTYPQVFVTDFQAGYSNYTASQWNTGWSISFPVTQSNVTSTVSTAGVVYASTVYATTLSASGSVYGTVFSGRATTAQYADLAEMYVSDRDYSPGTVVEFGGDKEITAATNTHSTQIAGVISTDPAYLMNSIQIGEYVLPVALTGRVPCRVIGKINKGDRLVSSNILGVAQALDIMLYQPGVIIGKAIEPYDSDKIGIIEVSVGRF